MRIGTYAIGETWWKQSALAGLVGGLAMAAFQGMLAMGLGQGPWWPLNLVGSVVPYFRTSSERFWAGTTEGLALHLITAIVYGLIYGLIVAVISAMRARSLARSWGFAVGGGVVFGLITWGVLALVAPPMPAGSFATDYLAAHVIFGLATALMLTAQARSSRVSIVFAPSSVRERELQQK